LNLALPEYANALRARYPGVRVVSCHKAHDSGPPRVYVRFQAPRSDLMRHGLMTQGMYRKWLAALRAGESSAAGRTEFGDRWFLTRGELDAKSRPGQWELFVSFHTDTPETSDAELPDVERMTREAFGLRRKAVRS
jgi:hypothetical protein